MNDACIRRLTDARLTVVVGHFGSGKTEFSVNLALALRQRHARVALADLDVVDPYFRSRECAELFAQRGIRLIAGAPNSHHDADLPSMPPEVQTLLDDQGLCGVLDIGGDASGARVLGRYRHALQRCGAQVLCVINANRPLSDTPEKMVHYIRSIEQSSGLAVTGLVNNTHCCHLTAPEDILTGADMARSVSEATGIGVVCHALPRHLRGEVALEDLFYMDLYMKKPWEIT